MKWVGDSTSWFKTPKKSCPEKSLQFSLSKVKVTKLSALPLGLKSQKSHIFKNCMIIYPAFDLRLLQYLANFDFCDGCRDFLMQTYTAQSACKPHYGNSHFQMGV